MQINTKVTCGCGRKHANRSKKLITALESEKGSLTISRDTRGVELVQLPAHVSVFLSLLAFFALTALLDHMYNKLILHVRLTRAFL